MNKVIGLIMCTVSINALAGESKEANIEKFAEGSYFLIGKKIDSKETYYGDVIITKNKFGLTVVREISSKVVTGSASIEYVAPDKVPTLKIKFSDAGNNYEESCILGHDLNNYARITCHLYIPGKKTVEPGMEALFINSNKSL